MTIDVDGTDNPVPVPDDGHTHHIAVRFEHAAVTCYVDGSRV